MIAFFQLLNLALKDFTLRILLIGAVISIIANEVVEEDQRNIGEIIFLLSEYNLFSAWIEGFTIFVAVVVCSVVTAVNDYQKEKQFQKLKEVSAAKKQVNVWRNGVLIKIHETQLVTGDIVKISEGMDIPVDILLIEAHEVTTDESALTGEPIPLKKKIFEECVAKRNEIVSKDQKRNAKAHDVYSPILLSGTSILTGEGKGLVLVVGASSIVGQIRKYLAQESEMTPLQEKLEKIAKDIAKFGLVSSIIILIVLLIRFFVERGVTNTWNNGQSYVQLIRFVIISIAVLAVAIPEGLPLSVTLTLAYSVKKMMRDNNLVRKLHATETMGGANNICCDKTGTLTQNKMHLTHIWNGGLIEVNPYKKETLNEVCPAKGHEIIKQAVGCNSSATLEPYFGSKTEIALLQFLRNRDIEYNNLRSQYLKPTSIKFPFSSQRKRMSSILDNVENGLPSKKRMHIKGASEIILQSCTHFYSLEQDNIAPMTEVMKQNIELEIETMAGKGLRTLCIAYKEIKGNEDFTSKDENNVYEIEKTDFILIGVLGIRDILRPEVKDAVAKCRAAGIKVRMVTGDNKITAKAIAIECGIINPEDEHSMIMTGLEFTQITGGVVCKKCQIKECGCPLNKEQAKKKNKDVRVDTIANQEEFEKIYRNLDVLARSRPEDKYALVTGLIERGCVVAVTGDGTNDAPALKKGDIGFAMNSGTDVAKEAADIVLLDDNFASIVKAAMWGRNIYENIKKFLQFQLTANIVAVVITLISASILREEVLSAVQLLWVNLIMDSLASLALATEPPTERLLDRPPHNRNEYIISKTMMKHILGQAFYQIIVVVMLVFSADSWVPEYLPHETIPGFPGEDKYYQDDGKHMRSGRPYFISDGDEDYARFYKLIGPSRHYTLIFNTFVFCQVFNFLNCRKIYEELNVFKGVYKNPFFVVIVASIAGLQIIIGSLGGLPFSVSLNGMDIIHWIIAVGFGSFTLIWSLILKFIPLQKLCEKKRRKTRDFYSSQILASKSPSKSESLERKSPNQNVELQTIQMKK